MAALELHYPMSQFIIIIFPKGLDNGRQVNILKKNGKTFEAIKHVSTESSVILS